MLRPWGVVPRQGYDGTEGPGVPRTSVDPRECDDPDVPRRDVNPIHPSWLRKDVNALEPGASDAAIIVRSAVAPDAFGLIFDRHAVSVHRFVARRAGAEAADDLLSDVFAAAFRRRDRFDPTIESALPWLYGIALNAMRRGWRSEASQQRIARRVEATTPVVSSHEDGTTERMDAARRWDSVRPIVDALPEGDRQALLLYAWEELTYAQIAVVLDIPVGTVRSRIHRARTQVRAGLDGLMTKENHHER